MIWCVEDDASTRDIEVYALKQTGFDACGFEDGQAMTERLKTEKPELIVLDVMLPGKDGVEILKELKKSPEYADIPVIMATAKGEEYDKIKGLDSGADYYLTKPFGAMEFVSCVKAVLRRYKPKNAKTIENGGLKLDDDAHTVFADGEKIVLTYKEFELLKLLLSAPGNAFTRDVIMERIWGYHYELSSRTLDMHVKTLRQKLGAKSGMIQTIRNVGFKLERLEE